MVGGMSLCGCAACSPGTVKWLYSEQWRNECEARHVLRMPRRNRRPWLVEALKRRGEARTLELVTEVLRQGGQDAMEAKKR